MTDVAIDIRRLADPTSTEIVQLAELFDRYRVHYGELADVAGSSSWLSEQVGRGRLTAFVAELDGALVGFATLVVIPASLRLRIFWQIRDLFVSPEHRRQGVARALLDAVRTAAIDAGAVRLSVQTEIDNRPALRLYAELGFEPVEGYRALFLSLED